MSKTRTFDQLSREGVAWVDRLKSGQMTQAEGEELERWCRQSPAHRDAFAAAVALLQVVREAGRSLVDRDVLHPARQRTWVLNASPFSRRAFLGGAIAASAGAAAYLTVSPPLGLWPSLTQIAGDLAADYKTGTGERRVLTVSQVGVDMNTQTGVSVLTGPAAGIKLIHGEAAIDTKGVPFVVYAGAGRVRTSRARFDVRYDGPTACVTCVAGTLRLEHRLGTTDMAAGQQVVYADHDLGKLSQSAPDLVTAWQRGLLIFHNEPLSRVVAEINRYRKGRIVLLNDELAHRTVYASFHIEKLDTAVEQIQHFSAAHMFRVGQVVFLS